MYLYYVAVDTEEVDNGTGIIIILWGTTKDALRYHTLILGHDSRTRKSVIYAFLL